ncbi:unnamed protein product [Laminaria digitata]
MKRCRPPPALVRICRFRIIVNYSTPHLKRPQGKHNEVLALLERALAIRTQTLGEAHEDTINTQKIVEVVRKQVRGQKSAVGSSGRQMHAHGADPLPNVHVMG